MSLSADELDELLGGLVHALANATTRVASQTITYIVMFSGYFE